MEEDSHKVRTSSGKTNQHLGQNVQCDAYGQHCRRKHREVVRKADPNSDHHKEELFFLFFLLYLCEKMDGSYTSCCHHFIIRVNQTTILGSLHLSSKVCQLFQVKLGKNEHKHTASLLHRGGTLFFLVYHFFKDRLLNLVNT